MSKVIVIGGHGKVARLLAPLLVEDGHSVTAVIRSQDQVAEVQRNGVEAVVTDVETMGAEQFAELLRGHDVVVWSAGAGGGDPERTYRVDQDAAIHSMQGALLAGVQRYIMVSYVGSSVGHGADPASSFYPYAQAKMIADAVLRDTDLDWTIVAPSGLTLDPGTGKVGHADTSKTVPRADVAALIVQCIADSSSVRRTLRFNSGEVPIAEYVQGNQQGLD